MAYAVAQGVALGWYALPRWGTTAPRHHTLFRVLLLWRNVSFFVYLFYGAHRRLDSDHTFIYTSDKLDNV